MLVLNSIPLAVGYLLKCYKFHEEVVGQVTPAEGALAQPALFQQGKGLVHALVPRLAKALLVELVALEQVALGLRRGRAVPQAHSGRDRHL